jgi:hypothetical protein
MEGGSPSPVLAPALAPPTSADPERAFELFLVVVTWLAVTTAMWTARRRMGPSASEPTACPNCGRAR